MWLLEHLTRSGESIVEQTVMEGAPKVDREKGVVSGIKLLGLTSRNKRRYLESTLESAAPIYEGSKVNINHPKGNPNSPRDYQERFGVIRNVQHRKGDGLYGDLHYNPKHPIAEQFAWDAEHAPQNVGMSHNVHAKTKQDKDGLVVEAISKVTSVDLVADPASTNGLFEHESQTLAEVIEAHKESDSPLLPVLEAFVAANQQMAQQPVMPMQQGQGAPQNNQLLAGLKSAMSALIDDASLGVDEILNIIRKAVGVGQSAETDDEDEEMFDNPEKKKKFEESVKAAVETGLKPLTEQIQKQDTELGTLRHEQVVRNFMDSNRLSAVSLGPERVKLLTEAKDEDAMKALLATWPPAVRNVRTPFAQLQEQAQAPAAPKSSGAVRQLLRSA